MKIPLRYQITEYDCGPTSIINAITCLFEREEIPPTLIYNIMKYTLDEFDTLGEENKGGTYTLAVKLLAHWINLYAKTKNFNINCDVLENEDVDINNAKVRECIDNNGVIVARVWQTCEHYVIITKIDDKYAYLFDPYYTEIGTYDNDSEVEIIKYRKLEYNRKVSLNRMMSDAKEDYSLVKNENKELLLLAKTKK